MTTNLEHLRQLAAIETDECTLWDRGRMGPYASVRGAGAGHRLVCLWYHGECPDGLEAAHYCGKGLCVNPRHLRWATHAENCADKAAHGTKLHGERHSQSVLTAEQVSEIRSCGLPVRELVDRFPVGRSQMYRILNGENWSTV